MRVILTGGGTGGSVSPLLAIAEEIKKRQMEVKFLFIGTKKGVPEKKLSQFSGFLYQGIFCGKLRRYFDWHNFFDPILLLLGTIQSVLIIKKFKPDIILSAGSFVSVPVIWAGWLLRIPSLIHQQDIIPGLANKIMTPFASKITVNVEKSLNDFSKEKTVLTGNPIRLEILNGSKEKAIERFNLESDLLTVLIFGGGTGAQKINQLIWPIISQLTKFCQIIHLTGKNKNDESPKDPPAGGPAGQARIMNYESSRYHCYEFLTKEMADAYAAADLVISRAGMGALTELSALAKPTIIIPIPNSHQEKNAHYFGEKNAAVILSQKNLNPNLLLDKIKFFLNNKEKLTELSKNMLSLSKLEATQNIVDQIMMILRSKD